MMIYLGADHRGFTLKEKVKTWLERWGLSYQDLGNCRLDPGDDYVDFAQAVAKRVATGKARGILLCGSGQGVSITANKFPGVRSVLAWEVTQARLGREHEDANILSLPADSLGDKEAKEIIKTWLNTPFTGEKRHQQRLSKIEKLEKELGLN